MSKKLDTLITGSREYQKDVLTHIEKLAVANAVAEEEVIHSVIMRNLRPPSLHAREDEISERHRKTFDWMLGPGVADETDSMSKIEANSSSSSSSYLAEDYVPVTSVNCGRHLPAFYYTEFVNWLQQGSGVFHIAGKPGSGKSTLLKFLANDARVQHHLQVWARSANKELVFSKFFFWRYGSDHQKSSRGLLHGLLFDMCVDSHQLTKHLFPDLWERVKNSSQDLRTCLARDITAEEIRAAFNRLRSDKHIRSAFRVCLFIDGLDEFSGHEPTSKLAEELLCWTEAAPSVATSNSKPEPFLKLCVSSREEFAIMKTFQMSHQIRLQKLTEGDIHEMVSTLAENQNFQQLKTLQPEECMSIVTEITAEASGVFLWVKLILNQLEEELTFGNASLASLRRIIQAAPRELDDFLLQIFDSVPKHNLLAASFIFSMAVRLLGYHLSDESKLPYELQKRHEQSAFSSPFWQPAMPAYGLGVICDALETTHGIEDFRNLLIFLAASSSQTEEKYEIRCEKTELTINKLCGGLLEVSKVYLDNVMEGNMEKFAHIDVVPEPEKKKHNLLKFSHRSIPEFLISILPARAREFGFGDVDVACAILTMHISETSARHTDYVPAAQFLMDSMCHIGDIIRLRQLQQPYATKILILLDRLEHAKSQAHLRRRQQHNPKWQGQSRHLSPPSGSHNPPDRDHALCSVYMAGRIRPSGDMLYWFGVSRFGSVLGMAIYHRLYEYIQWVLESDGNIRMDPVWMFIIFVECPSWLQKLQELGLPYRSPPLAIPLPPSYNMRQSWLSVWELRDHFSRDNIRLGEGIITLDMQGYPLATRRWSANFAQLFASLSFKRSVWPRGFPMWAYVAHLLMRNLVSKHWLRPVDVKKILPRAIESVKGYETACHGFEACASFLEETNPICDNLRVQVLPRSLFVRVQDRLGISLREIVAQLQPDNWRSLLHLIDTYKDVEYKEPFFDGYY